MCSGSNWVSQVSFSVLQYGNADDENKGQGIMLPCYELTLKNKTKLHVLQELLCYHKMFRHYLDFYDGTC